MKKILIIESIFIFLVFSFFLLGGLDLIISREVLYESAQPAHINYQSYDPYVLRIFKFNTIFDSKYYIFISTPESTYGHLLSYPHNSLADERVIKDTKVLWKDDGIDIRVYLDIEIFIPKGNFTGGR